MSVQLSQYSGLAGQIESLSEGQGASNSETDTAEKEKTESVVKDHHAKTEKSETVLKEPNTAE